VLQRWPVALLHRPGAGQRASQPATARSGGTAGQQGAPARPRRRRQPVAAIVKLENLD
jgi:hypothetical protein